jgi:hypothetical protein
MILKCAVQGPTSSVYCRPITRAIWMTWIEIVGDPGGEELAQGDRPELGVLPASIEVGRLERERFQRSDVGGAEARELVEELVQRLPARGLLLSESVEGLERALIAGFEDHARARHPVGLLAVDQMPHDVERSERIGALVAMEPGVGQTAEDRVERARRALEDGDRLVEGEGAL